ncbi:lipoprotein LipO [Spirochaetia bacterium]|nr:lipoprotein LipO [Spirochaetia bacterium]
MKKCKKSLFFSAALMVALFFTITIAACSRSGFKAPAASTGPDKVTILLEGDTNPNAQNIVLDELGKKTNTVIDMIYTAAGEYGSKLSILVAGGTPPDIFRANSNTAQEFIDAGLLADVSKYLDTLGPNILADVGNVLYQCQVNKNGVYMIPDGNIYYAMNLCMRTDWLKNLGMDLPTDLNSLYKVYYAFTYNDPDGNGKKDTFGLAANTFPDMKAFASIFGAFGIPHNSTIIQDDGTLTTWVKHPQYLDAVTYIRRLIADGLVEPDWVTIPAMDMFAKLWNGVAGAIEWECYGPTNNWMPVRYTEAVTPTFGFPIIRGPDGKHGVRKQFPSLGSGTVISSKANIEAAIRIADFCKTPEGSDLLFLGVEDVMYRWTDKVDGKYEYLGKYTDLTTHRAEGGFVYGGLFPPRDNAQWRTLNKQSREGSELAWSEGLDNTANVIADLKTWVEYGPEMNQIVREMYAQLLTTKEDLRTVYNRFLREWEVAGGIEWEKEVNAAWIAQGRKN